ncbi:MAG: N-acetyltransferase [Rhodospirillales bacterium]|nr:N-acetyltransferase [Rhodospirillales bacterium]
MSALAGATTVRGQASAVVRPADAADLAAIQAIYAHHVGTGTGTFEEAAPDEVDMAARRDAILARGLPYLVADSGGAIAGFAYAAQFRPRSAYRFTVEDSIYVHPDAVGSGVGRALLGQLIARCEAMGYRQMVAVIGDSANHRSIRLHKRLGFVEAGRLLAAGFKFGRWLDVVFMQRALDGGNPEHRR